MLRTVDERQGSSMGNFPLFVHPSCPDDDIAECSWTSSDRAVPWNRDSPGPKARPGYFGISLENGLHAEMTVTNHSALYRFRFPDGRGTSPLVLLDIIDLPQSRNEGTAWADAETGRLTASGSFNPSFGEGTYNIHVCVDFHGAEIRDTGSWTNRSAEVGQSTVSVTANSSYPASQYSAGTFVRFASVSADDAISARVGVSFMSVEQACSNGEKEQPDFDFEQTRAAAESAWRKKMDVITIDAEGASTELQKVFWSGAYRAMISPQDYPLWESDEPYYDSFYW
jgi:putative alpha-1,2-mannosidase